MKDSLKNKAVTISILLITILLAGVAVFTAIRLYQLRQAAVAPNAPSQPLACHCDSVTVTPNEDGTYRVAPEGSSPWWQIIKLSDKSVIAGPQTNQTFPSVNLSTGSEYQVQAAPNQTGPWTTTGCTFQITAPTPTPTPELTPTPIPPYCGWCGTYCVLIDPKNPPKCLDVPPPPDKTCKEVNGVCTEIPNNTPTPTEIPTPTPTATPSTEACTSLTFTLTQATPTPTETPQETPTPTPTPEPGKNTCGGTCGSDSNCQSDYTCYNGFCRRPACPESENCVCAPTPPPASTPTPTATPRIPSGSATPTPPALPASGISFPTIIGVVTGVSLLILSLGLAL
jgi:hypothetical protein